MSVAGHSCSVSFTTPIAEYSSTPMIPRSSSVWMTYPTLLMTKTRRCLSQSPNASKNWISQKKRVLWRKHFAVLYQVGSKNLFYVVKIICSIGINKCKSEEHQALRRRMLSQIYKNIERMTGALTLRVANISDLHTVMSFANIIAYKFNYKLDTIASIHNSTIHMNPNIINVVSVASRCQTQLFSAVDCFSQCGVSVGSTAVPLI